MTSERRKRRLSADFGDKDLQKVFKEFNTKLENVTTQVGELATFKEGMETFKEDAQTMLIMATAPKGTGEDYQSCMKEQMEAGKSMAEAAKHCKAKFPPKEEPAKAYGAGELITLLDKAGIKLGEEDKNKLIALIGEEALNLEHLREILGEIGEQYPATALAKVFKYLERIKGSELSERHIKHIAGLLGAKKTGELFEFPEKVLLRDESTGIETIVSILPQEELRTGEQFEEDLEKTAELVMTRGLEHQKEEKKE